MLFCYTTLWSHLFSVKTVNLFQVRAKIAWMVTRECFCGDRPGRYLTVTRERGESDDTVGRKIQFFTYSGCMWLCYRYKCRKQRQGINRPEYGVAKNTIATARVDGHHCEGTNGAPDIAGEVVASLETPQGRLPVQWYMRATLSKWQQQHAYVHLHALFW